ncbi:MAG TPA: hypothetical protein ENN43_01315 [bacterium]|nr:hypothetical protein [bacterium]
MNRFFRIGPDYFNEAAYKEFDYVMDSAARHGTRVIIHFSDNWEYYGGAKVYAQWAGHENKNMLWTDPKANEYYRQTIKKFITRKNTVNGKLYRDDPAIFAWDLMNEPRNENDPTGEVLNKWIEETADYIKSLDPNHMVTTGSEGYYLGEDGTHYSGSDFIGGHKPKSIDFCTYHIYPTYEHNSYAFSTVKWLLDRWISDAHNKVGKPVVMEEYGIASNNPAYPKAKWINDMTGYFFEKGGNGVNYWFFIDPSYTYGDGFEVNPTETEYMNVFIKHANRINKNGY